MRLSTIGGFTLVLGFAVGLVAGREAAAQAGLRGPGPVIGGFHLLIMPAIQRELQMDETQVEKAREVAGQMKKRFDQDMGNLKGLTGDEHTKRIVSLANAHYDEGMRQLRSFLKPEQIDRFDQILLQQRGPMAMLEPRIQKSLQVTNEQATKIAQLATDDTNEKREVARSTGGKPTSEGLARFEEISTRTNAQAAEILSPEQRRTWQRIAGEPFSPDMPKPGGSSSAAKSTRKSAGNAAETGEAPTLSGKP